MQGSPRISAGSEILPPFFIAPSLTSFTRRADSMLPGYKSGRGALFADVAQNKNGRGNCFKYSRVRVRIPPSALHASLVQLVVTSDLGSEC